MGRHRLTLYVTGDTLRSQQAIANLRRICEEHLNGEAECMVIDVLDRPEVAEAQRILTTPTLVKESPAPARRVTGDLSDSAQVLFWLAMRPAGPRTHSGANQ